MLVLLYFLKIHNIYQSQLRPCVCAFLPVRAGFMVTDGGFVWLGSWRVTPQGAPVQEWTCCSLCFCLLEGLALTPLSCSLSSLPFHLSPKTYITCQIHSVNAGLIKMLHCKGTGSLWGCGVCMNDTHTCKFPPLHTH